MLKLGTITKVWGLCGVLSPKAQAFSLRYKSINFGGRYTFFCRALSVRVTFPCADSVHPEPTWSLTWQAMCCKVLENVSQHDAEISSSRKELAVDIDVLCEVRVAPNLGQGCEAEGRLKRHCSELAYKLIFQFRSR